MPLTEACKNNEGRASGRGPHHTVPLKRALYAFRPRKRRYPTPKPTRAIPTNISVPGSGVSVSSIVSNDMSRFGTPLKTISIASTSLKPAVPVNPAMGI